MLRFVQFLRRAHAAVLLGLAIPLLAAPATAEWLPVQGRAAVQGNYARALFEAERQAMTRGLARYLQQWMTVEEIESQSAILNDRMFRSPRAYVLATSSVSTRQSGIQAIWQGLVQYNHQRVEASLREFGLINAWDITPVVAVTIATGAAQAVSQGSWYRLLSDSGFELVPAKAELRTPPNGFLNIRQDNRTQTHPLDPEQMLTLSDIIVEGRIAGQQVAGRIPVAPPERLAQSNLAAALLADQMLAAWAPHYLEARQSSQWTAGTFMFDDTAHWLAFDRAILKQRALFHGVYPHLVERRAGRLFITYRFFLNENDVDTAISWLAVNQFDVTHVPPRTLSVQ